MTLNPGDLLFVGWDSDNNDIAFVATTDIAPGEVIYFTDNEWDGDSFNTNEQLMEWTVPASGIAAGTVVTIDMDRDSRTASIDGGGDFDYIRGGYSIGTSNEMFWAFQGTRDGDTVTPDNFVAVIGNEADGNSNQTPNLDGTGLTPSNGALIIDGDEDYMEYVGEAGLDSPVERGDLVASILDQSNWQTADGGGNNNPNPGGGFDVVLPPVICFVAGARIATPDGPRAVEELRPGDFVLTRDRGAQPILWRAERRVRATGRFAPVAIAAGALGNHTAFQVSPQHRILISGWRAELIFGEGEVLVPAKALINDTSIRRQPGGWVTYVHILCDHHEIVDVEGCATETLLPGSVAMSAVDAAAKSEVAALFGATDQHSPEPARPIVVGYAGLVV